MDVGSATNESRGIPCLLGGRRSFFAVPSNDDVVALCIMILYAFAMAHAAECMYSTGTYSTSTLNHGGTDNFLLTSPRQ